ncbi:MAG: type II CAAX prenyl endopeptidase Rce1 family protein [Promethearchaeota archaeon]
MLNEIDKPALRKNSETKIHNQDLLYPFAILLFILSFSDLTGYLTILTFFSLPILEILEEFLRIGSTESMNIFVNLLINLAAQMGSIVIFLFLYKKKKVEPEEKRMPSGSHLITIFLLYSILSTFSFGIAIVAIALEEYGISFKSPYEVFQPTLELLGIPIFYVLFFSFYIVGASVSEELAFRRTLIPFLERRGLGTFWALLISSLLFSLMHSPQDILFGSIGYTFIHFFGTFAGGLALGFLYMRTRNIVWPIILHGLNNGVAAIAQIALVRWEQLGDFSLFMVYSVWFFTALAVGTATIVYLIIQMIRSRSSPYPPVWFRLFKDVNVRPSRLLPISYIALGFIGITSGIPLIFTLFFDLLDDSSMGFLILQYTIEAGLMVLLIAVVAFFVFKKASPLEEPDWVSNLTLSHTIVPSYPLDYPTPGGFAQNFCGSCGREIVPNTQFCVYCGEKMSGTCVSCGKEIIANAEYCVYCGMKI